MGRLTISCLTLCILYTCTYVRGHDLRLYESYELKGREKIVRSNGECTKSFQFWPELKSLIASEGAECAVYNDAECTFNRCVHCVNDEGELDISNHITDLNGLSVKCVSANSKNVSCTCETFSGASENSSFLGVVGAFMLVTLLLNTQTMLM